MGLPAAKMGDTIVSADIHIVMVPSPGGPVPTPQPLPFNGRITLATIPTVRINGRPAATVGSMANNIPPHIPVGGPFQRPPTNLGRVVRGSLRVRVAGKPAARATDMCETCHDIPPAGPQVPPALVVVIGAPTVMIG